MRIVGRHHLVAFCAKHADVRVWIEHWLYDVEVSVWTNPHELRRSYASASFLADNRVVFNVKGNAYRLEAHVLYQTSIVIIKWIGTHSAYDTRNKSR